MLWKIVCVILSLLRRLTEISQTLLRNYTLLTHWHTFIVFLYTRLHYLRFGVKGQSSIWNSGFIHYKYHTGWTALAMIDPCTCNAVKIPIMSLKFCEKSYVSCRPYCVGWLKYLKLSYAITRCWHTGIHLLYFCTHDFIFWGLDSKVKVAYQILLLFIVNIIQAELL